MKKVMEKSHIIWNDNNPNNKVKKGELIHHKNENHDDDTPINQEKMLWGEHTTLHMIGNKNALGYKHTEETKKKISLAQIGNKNGLGNKNTLGYKHTEETKRKMSEAKIGKDNGRTGCKHSEETKRRISNGNKGKHFGKDRKKETK